MYLLDTNICIYIIKKRPPTVLTRFEKINPDEICISVITLAELNYGVERSSSKKLNRRIVNEFKACLKVLPWDESCAAYYGNLRAYLELKGSPIGNMDLMIASHALAFDYILVSNNIKEFKRVPDLRFENWI